MKKEQSKQFMMGLPATAAEKKEIRDFMKQNGLLMGKLTLKLLLAYVRERK